LLEKGIDTEPSIRASRSRPSGSWSDDDYDVFDGGQDLLSQHEDLRFQDRPRPE